MSQRIAGATVAPVHAEPLPGSERPLEPPTPYVIRSDEVRPKPFALTGPSPRARVKNSREPARTPEVEVGASGRPTAVQRAVGPDRAAAKDRGTPASPSKPQVAPEASAPSVEPFVPAGYHSPTSGLADLGQPEADQRQLATAVFVAGSARLQPGHRYSLALRPGRLLVLGPTDVDPAAVVVDRDVADIEVRSLDGRLILSEPHSRSGLVLAFMSVAGQSTENLASTIAEAGRSAGAA